MYFNAGISPISTHLHHLLQESVQRLKKRIISKIKTLRGQYLSRSFFALYGVSGRELQVFFDLQYNVSAKEVRFDHE